MLMIMPISSEMGETGNNKQFTPFLRHSKVQKYRNLNIFIFSLMASYLIYDKPSGYHFYTQSTRFFDSAGTFLQIAVICFSP